MTFTRFLFALLAVSITSCTTPNSIRNSPSDLSQTISTTYHIKRGKEAEFQAVLARAWQIYRREHLVFARPHIIVREVENGDEPVFHEYFTWITNSAPMNVTNPVKEIWRQEQLLCEARLGHPSIENVGSIPTDVQIITVIQ